MINEQPLFKQGTMGMVCKKLYRGKIEPTGFIDVSLDVKNYPDHDYHYIYIGEIESIYVNEKINLFRLFCILRTYFNW